MPIAITCSGCSAAFEVPDTLAGKTIRCTSCKTQLNVPESVAASTQAGTKKPFGWAGSADKAANSAPMSLDDDTQQAAAKTPQASKPVPSAKPAVAKKPLAKSDVTVDDDDDEEEEANTRKKTSPNKSSTKPVAKATTKKRRDDDDDDDDRPQQKKTKKNKTKNKGGSGSPIVLIGGGILALATIAGLSITFLSGNSKKKEETASSTSDSKPALSGPAYGGSGSGGPGGRPGGPGGKPGGPGGGPGMPGGSADNPMPGGTGTPGGNGMPSGNPMIGGPGMPGPGATTPVGADGWQTFTVGGFSAEMPGKPILKKEETIQTPFGSSSSKVYVLENTAADEAFFVVEETMPGTIDTPEAIDKFFIAAIAEMEKRFASMPGKAGKLGFGTTTDTKQDGFPARDLQLVEKGGVGGGLIRIVLVRNKFFTFGAAAGKYANIQDQNKRFMSSVKISATSGDAGNVASGGPNGSPGRPPMGGSAGGPQYPMNGSAGGPQYPMNGSGGGPNRPPMAGGGPMQPGGVSPPGAAYGQQGAGGPNRPPMAGGGGPMQPGGVSPPGAAYGQQGAGGPMQPGGFGGQPGGFGGQPGGFGGPMQPGGFGGQPGGFGGGAGMPGRPNGGQPGRPNGGQPGRPGMGGPGGGVGGGQTDPNPPPSGVNIDGHLKHKIDTFYTAAFMEQKAFFTITSRQEKSKLLGTLTWHEYPSFTFKGSYKLPHLATRAVIDPAKGLLYIATVPIAAGATIAPHQYDLASATGDVQVFELNPLMDESNPTPPGAELKPLATIPIGKSIHGLELSNDGKFLFVASTTTSKTSSIVKIDTETHKPTGTPLALPETVWEMRKTADGKSLLVLDAAPHVVGKTAMIRVYNQEKLTEEKQPAKTEGIANHMASAPGGVKGEVALTVAGSGATLPSKLYVIGNGGSTEMQLGIGWKAAANGPTAGYVEYSPDGKLLFVSAYRAAGIDAYEVSNDSAAITQLKKKASIRTASTQKVGGHFFISPDGLYLIDHHGIVIETANIGGSNGEALNAGAFGQPGGPGGFAPGGPGGFAPGGMVPGGPGGFAPGGMVPGGAPGMVPGGGPGAPGGPGKLPGKIPPAPGGMPGTPPAAPGGMPPVPGMPPAPGGMPLAPGGMPMPPAPGAPNPGK